MSATRQYGSEIWELAKLKPEAPFLEDGNMGLSVACGGASLLADFPMHVLKKEPTLRAVQEEVYRLRAVAAGRAGPPETKR